MENFGVEASYYQADHFLNEEETPPTGFDFERFKLNYFGLNFKYFFQILVVQPNKSKIDRIELNLRMFK
jgi:hypothetical protein